jgi:lipid II:glycine glycyltransferase (peptidoglycan interpeptide bridge formation enzyme)
MRAVERILTSTQDQLSAPVWDELALRLPDSHILQSWTWGDLKARFGWPDPVRLAVIEDGRPLAAAQVLFRPLPVGWWTTAYVPKGPLLDTTRPDTARALLAEIHDLCQRRRAVSLKVEPDWEYTTDGDAWWQDLGFCHSAQTVQPRRTVVVSLETEETSILAQMKSKTRYNVRLASRRGVTVRQGAAADLPTFYRLLKITSDREGFGIHTEEYYSEVWQAFAACGCAALLIAERQGRDLAALMAFRWGSKAWYLYGASSGEERQRMPNHVLQWEAMRWAKAGGCRTYDLWGIPDLDESQVGPDIDQAEKRGVLSRGMGGLYRFKRGFGGREVRYLGAYDYVYSAPLYRLLSAAWRWRSA